MKISYKVLFAAVLSIAGTNAFAADVTGLATTNYVKGAIQSLDGAVTGTTGVVKTISQTDGKITATRGLIGDTEVDKISTSKITGNLDVSRITKGQTTDNMVNPNADGQIPTADAGSTTKYPSIKAAQQIASAVVTENLIDVNDEISSLNTKYTNLSATVETNKGAADDAIKALDSSVTNANGAISTITITDGKITNVTRKSVATADLADNAVTTAKIVNANVTKAKLASDVQTSLGKADNSLQKAASATYTDGHVLKVDASGNVVDGGALGSLATKSNVTNADISGTINQDKITGLTTALSGKQATLTTGENGNIKGGGSVTVTKDATSGVITISGTDTKYTLPAANDSTRGGVVTGGDITATNGTLTITNGKVTSTKIADDAVTTAKIKGFDNSGSTKECADGKCALVDLGSGAQWLPIVNEYK